MKELTAQQLDKSPIKIAERKKWQTVFEQHPEFFKTYTLRGEPRVAAAPKPTERTTAAAAATPGGEPFGKPAGASAAVMSRSRRS